MTLFPPAGNHVWEVWGSPNNETALFVLQGITAAGMNQAVRISREQGVCAQEPVCS